MSTGSTFSIDQFSGGTVDWQTGLRPGSSRNLMAYLAQLLDDGVSIRLVPEGTHGFTCSDAEVAQGEGTLVDEYGDGISSRQFEVAVLRLIPIRLQASFLTYLRSVVDAAGGDLNGRTINLSALAERFSHWGPGTAPQEAEVVARDTDVVSPRRIPRPPIFAVAPLTLTRDEQRLAVEQARRDVEVLIQGLDPRSTRDAGRILELRINLERAEQAYRESSDSFTSQLQYLNDTMAADRALLSRRAVGLPPAAPTMPVVSVHVPEAGYYDRFDVWVRRTLAEHPGLVIAMGDHRFSVVGSELHLEYNGTEITDPPREAVQRAFSQSFGEEGRAGERLRLALEAVTPQLDAETRDLGGRVINLTELSQGIYFNRDATAVAEEVAATLHTRLDSMLSDSFYTRTIASLRMLLTTHPGLRVAIGSATFWVNEAGQLRMERDGMEMTPPRSAVRDALTRAYGEDSASAGTEAAVVYDMVHDVDIYLSNRDDLGAVTINMDQILRALRPHVNSGGGDGYRQALSGILDPLLPVSLTEETLTRRESPEPEVIARVDVQQ